MGIASNLRDARLVARALAHDSAAFGELVRLHMPAVSAVALAYTRRHADAEDVTQDAFLKAWQSLDTLRTPRQFGAWVTIIARNTAINHLHRTRHEHEKLEIYRGEASMTGSGGGDTNEAMRELLPTLVAALPDADRELVLMRYHAGKRTREIAALLAISHAAVRKRLERIRHALGEALLTSLAPDAAEKVKQEHRAHRVASAVVAVTPSWKYGAAGAAGTGAAAIGLSKAAFFVVVILTVALGSYLLRNREPRPILEVSSAAMTSVQPVAPTKDLEPNEVVPGQPAIVDETDAGLKIAVTGATIGGRLVETDTDTGVPGATIELYTPDGTTRLEAETDAMGQYQLEGLAPGEYWLSLKWDDDLCWRYPRGRYNRQEQNVRVSIGESVTGVDFAVVGGVTVRGRVLGPDGAPLAGAVVEAWSKPNEVESKVTTDGDGRFEFRGFATELPAYFWPHYDGFAMPPHGPVEVPVKGLGDLVLRMGVESRIAGVLVDQDGNPLAGVRVGAWPEDLYALSNHAETDELGRFEARGLHASRYHFVIQLPDDSNSHRLDSTQDVVLVEGEHLRGVELVYTLAGELSISGRITDDQGAPERNIHVWTSRGSESRTSDTDSQGNYELTGLAPGVYTVTAQGVSWQGPGFTSVEAEAGAENVDFVFARPSNVSGNVIDAATLQPIPRFEVMCPGPAMRWTAFHNPDGAFRLPSLQVVDTITLAARAEGYATGLSEELALKSGESRENVVLRLERAGRISGRVFAPDGSRLRDAGVGVDDGMFGGGVQTNDSGEYVILGARPGSWSLRAWHPQFAPGEVRVTVTAGEETEADIHLLQGARVVGTVTRGGEIQPSARVELTQWLGEHEIGFNKECDTDKEGRYVFEGVPAGELTLRTNPMVDGQGRVIEVPVAIAGSDESVVNIDMFDGAASAVFDVALSDALAARDGHANIELEYRFDSGEVEKYYTFARLNEPMRLEGVRPGTAMLSAKYYSAGIGEVLSATEPVEVEIRDGVENRFEIRFEE